MSSSGITIGFSTEEVRRMFPDKKEQHPSASIYEVSALPNFDSPIDDLTDVTLVLDGTKLHVHKLYLSVYSSVFKAMFSSNFKEREQKEIELNDSHDEFLELLRIIYPSRKPIDEKNVEFILKLADKYDMKNVMDECEKFLMVENKFSIVKQLVFADKYSLEQLKRCCMQHFKSIFDIRKLKENKEYDELSKEIKASLFEKVMIFL